MQALITFAPTPTVVHSLFFISPSLPVSPSPSCSLPFLMFCTVHVFCGCFFFFALPLCTAWQSMESPGTMRVCVISANCGEKMLASNKQDPHTNTQRAKERAKERESSVLQLGPIRLRAFDPFTEKALLMVTAWPLFMCDHLKGVLTNHHYHSFQRQLSAAARDGVHARAQTHTHANTHKSLQLACHTRYRTRPLAAPPCVFHPSTICTFVLLIQCICHSLVTAKYVKYIIMAPLVG